MELDEIILSLAEQAKDRLSLMTHGDEWDGIHIHSAYVLLEAAEALRRQSIVMDGMRRRSQTPKKEETA